MYEKFIKYEMDMVVTLMPSRIADFAILM